MDREAWPSVEDVTAGPLTAFTRGDRGGVIVTGSDLCRGGNDDDGAATATAVVGDVGGLQCDVAA